MEERHDWDNLRGRLAKELTRREGIDDRLEVIDEAVDAGRLAVDELGGAIEARGLDADAAARILRLLAAVIDHPEIASDGEVVAVAGRLARHGSYPTSQLVNHPAMAKWLVATRWRFDPMPRDEMARELEAYLDAERIDDGGLSDREFRRLLRRFRHRQLLRIFLRELEGASVRRTTAEVADVAEVCLEEALRQSARRLQRPDLADGLTIFGMGKLGGRELNYSSDVDLVFAAADGVVDNDDGALERFVRHVVASIDEITEAGRVFRVDLRLRPHGESGRLVPSESGLVDYYLNWGRTWERGAWLKARPVAGDRATGRRILEQLEPFLYRRHLDYESIDELRRMKALIDEESRADDFVRTSDGRGTDSSASRRSVSPFKARLLQKFDGHRSSPSTEEGTSTSSGGSDVSRSDDDRAAGWDVKIGRGGIREIEFFVQALQLVHCGLQTDLRVRTTLTAIDRLLYAGLLSAAEHRQLADAYDLFRRLEHRIQMASDRQTHRMPNDERGLRSLAGRMGMGVDELRTSVDESRTQVRTMFERLFSESPQRPDQSTVAGDRDDGALERLGGLPADRLLDESVLDRLREAGFSRPRQIAGQLQVLRRKQHGPFSESPTSADPELARYLLRAVREAPDPEDALGHLVQFSTAVGDTPSTWSMLADNPHAARLLIHLFGSSPPIAGLLAEEPELFERLIYGPSARIVRDNQELGAELRDQLRGIDDRARRMGRIRRFHREEVVRLALHEVAGGVDVETTFRQLTDLAERVIDEIVREVVDEYATAHDDVEWSGDALQSVGLSVVALGKLGGGEMGFGSDLDVIFVYDGDCPGGLDQQTATRLARRLVRAMSTGSVIGDLYDVDLRLRPSGSRGTLVVSLDAWAQYHRERAAFWERLALVRARPLTGPKALREAIDRGRRELVFERPVPDEAVDEVRTMRGRLREKSRSEEGGFDVNFDDGGLLDVEFLTQWLQLCAGTKTTAWQERSTFEALRALEAAPQGFGGVDLAGLIRDYSWLRRLESRLDISGLGPVLPEGGRVRRALIRQMGHQGREGRLQFDSEMQAVRARVHGAWQAVFGDGSPT